MINSLFSNLAKLNKKPLFDITDDLHRCLTIDNSMIMGTIPMSFDVGTKNRFYFLKALNVMLVKVISRFK